jgi:beta-xylosidase
MAENIITRVEQPDAHRHGVETANQFCNPVYARDFPDPHVLLHDGVFYAYATHSGSDGFQVLTSVDMVRWTKHPDAYRPPWSKTHLWAPEVIHYRGQFFMTYSARNSRSRKHDIGIATSDNPLGPFRHRAILVSGDKNRVGVIDTHVFIEDDVPHLLYSEESPRRIVMRRMASDLLSLWGDPIELLRPDRYREQGVTEAPTLVKRNGLYHLFFSAGHYMGSRSSCRYCVEHAVSHSLTGPYVKSETPLLGCVPGQVIGPGHQCLIDTPAGETWMLYHGWDHRNQPRYGSNPLGRTLRLDRLVWEGDKPRVLGPTLTPQPAPLIQA